VGVGLRVPHLREIFATRPEVDLFEIISDNFMVDGGPPLANLDRILERYPVVQHGVGLNLAGTDPLDRDYLARLKTLTRRTGTPWFSDHLCWSRSGDAHLHDLLPVPYTEAVIDWCAARARFVQETIGLPFAIENLSSYVSFAESTMPEWTFYREVAERADCKMLLDVNNVLVSSVNHGFDPWDYLAAVPWERVVQIHVAGHTLRDDGGRLDTHDGPVSEPVWALYAEAHARTGGVATILEWDEHHVTFAETLAEALRANELRANEQEPR